MAFKRSAVRSRVAPLKARQKCWAFLFQLLPAGSGKGLVAGLVADFPATKAWPLDSELGSLDCSERPVDSAPSAGTGGRVRSTDGPRYRPGFDASCAKYQPLTGA